MSPVKLNRGVPDRTNFEICVIYLHSIIQGQMGHTKHIFGTIFYSRLRVQLLGVKIVTDRNAGTSS